MYGNVPFSQNSASASSCCCRKAENNRFLAQQPLPCTPARDFVVPALVQTSFVNLLLQTSSDLSPVWAQCLFIFCFVLEPFPKFWVPPDLSEDDKIKMEFSRGLAIHIQGTCFLCWQKGDQGCSRMSSQTEGIDVGTPGPALSSCQAACRCPVLFLPGMGRV